MNIAGRFEISEGTGGTSEVVCPFGYEVLAAFVLTGWRKNEVWFGWCKCQVFAATGQGM